MATYKKLSSALNQLPLDVFERSDLLVAAERLSAGENVSAVAGDIGDRCLVTVGMNNNGRYYSNFIS